MDNITHSLVGAVMGQAGLKRKTGMAMPALIIGANLPDNQRWHREPGLLFEPHLAHQRAKQAMGKIVHRSLLPPRPKKCMFALRRILTRSAQ